MATPSLSSTLANDVSFNPTMNFNCTAHFGYDLVADQALPLLPLCREFTAIAVGLLSFFFESCNLNEDGPRPCDGKRPDYCLADVIATQFKTFKGRLHQVIVGIHNILRHSGDGATRVQDAIADSFLQYLGAPECTVLSHHEGGGSCQPLAGTLLACMKQSRLSGILAFQHISAALSIQRSGLHPRWTYQANVIQGRGVTGDGEGLPDGEYTLRASLLLELLKKTIQINSTRNPVVAEIGVAEGPTSYMLLHGHPDVRLLLVDSYMQSLKDSNGMPLDFVAASQRLSPYKDRIEWFRQSSVQAANYIVDQSLDLVFIDGDHQYEGAREDLRSWWPKVRIGGTFVGHDYHSSGVVRAVNEFALLYDLELHTDGECWWVFRIGRFGVQ